VVCSNNVSIYYTISEILPLMLCTSLPVTLKSPSVSIRRLKLQPMCTVQFTFKHIIDNTCCIWRGTGVRKVSNSKVTFNVTQGHWYWWNLIGHVLLVLCYNYVCILHCFQDIVSYFPKMKDVMWPRIQPLWCHLHACANTHQYQYAH